MFTYLVPVVLDSNHLCVHHIGVATKTHETPITHLTPYIQINRGKWNIDRVIAH